VNDFGVIKGTNDLKNSVHGTNMGQKGVSEAGASGCPLIAKRALDKVDVRCNDELTAVKPAISMQVRKAGTREAGL
jgi:hypothetical protein